MGTTNAIPEDVLSEDQVLREVLGIPKGDFRFGIRVSIFNHEMRSRREKRGWRQVDLAKVLGVSIGTISFIETFKLFPSDTLGKKIASALGTTTEVLFPAWLKFYLTDRSTRVFVSSVDELREALEAASVKRITGGSKPKSGKVLKPTMIKSAVCDPTEEAERIVSTEELKVAMANVLQTLYSSERRVIALRFGLQGDEPMTFKEIGNLLNLSREKLHQITTEALRKLKHPYRSRKLSAFLYANRN